MPGVVDTAFDLASEAATSARSFLASDQGRKIRRNVATVVIVGAPLISELPVIRKSRAARLLRTAAIATLMVKGAEWLRDWEPSGGPQSAEEVRGSHGPNA